MQIELLRQSYPLVVKWQHKVRLILYLLVFVFSYLIIFQPLHIKNIPHPQKINHILGYVGITGSVLSFNLFVIPYFNPGFFHERSWQVYKEIFWNNLHIVLTGLGSYFFTVFLGNIKLNFENLFQFQLMTFSVGIFPLTCMMAFTAIRLVQKKWWIDQLSKNRHTKKAEELVSRFNELKDNWS